MCRRQDVYRSWRQPGYVRFLCTETDADSSMRRMEEDSRISAAVADEDATGDKGTNDFKYVLRR